MSSFSAMLSLRPHPLIAASDLSYPGLPGKASLQHNTLLNIAGVAIVAAIIAPGPKGCDKH